MFCVVFIMNLPSQYFHSIISHIAQIVGLLWDRTQQLGQKNIGMAPISTTIFELFRQRAIVVPNQIEKTKKKYNLV